jgi:hypothetical protein
MLMNFLKFHDINFNFCIDFNMISKINIYNINFNYLLFIINYFVN